MKATIVTFNRAYNYGAVLQCYALAKIIKDNGSECEVLDYFPPRFRHVYYRKSTNVMQLSYKVVSTLFENRTPKRFKRNKRKMIAFNQALRERNKNFESFVEKALPLTSKTIYSKIGMRSVRSDCDCYITGSDQVWHNKWCDFDKTFFLDFPDANSKLKISYAASFGMKQLPNELVNEYKRRLQDFDMISVREESGVKIINDLINKPAVVSCDPTLLLDCDAWSEICDESIAEKEPYILVYYTCMSDKLQKCAKKLSEKTGYKVVSLPCTISPYVMSGEYDAPYGFDLRAESGPAEFLSLFKNAKYILTNTFHGTVFSVIFKKQFQTALISNGKEMNTRAAELLKNLNINNRDLMDDENDIDEAIDWCEVSNRLNDIREESTSYIKKMIALCDDK